MARLSRCDKLPEQDRLRLVGKIGDGVSWRELSAEFGIPFATIKEWAERNGYQRSVVAAKRKRVDEILATPETVHQTVHCAVTTGNENTDAAADRDADVARQAARVSVDIIQRLSALVSDDPDAKETVMIASALDKAWGTYARINKLDDAKPEEKAAPLALHR